MAIRFGCPHCGKQLSVKDELAGKKGPCPACKKIITIPASSGSGSHAPLGGSAPGAGQKPVAPPGGTGVGRPRPGAPRPPAKTNPGTAAPRTPESGSPSPARGPSASPEDLEREAAALFADKPATPAPVVAGKTIDFPCPHCDAIIKATADLEGKQTPCTNPECRRIVRVPRLEKKQPIDWRKTAAQGPSLARREGPAAPEGAWSSTEVAGVSATALSEAGAVPEEVERTPLSTWIRRGVIGFVVCSLVIAITWWRLSSAARSQQDDLAGRARKQVDPEHPKIGPQEDAIIFLALGEYELRKDKKGAAKEARDDLRNARHLLKGAPVSLERDTLLIELALLQVELGGDEAQVDKKLKLGWDETKAEIAATIDSLAHLPGRGMASYGPRAEALRLVCRKLLERKQVQVAYALAASGGAETAIESEPDKTGGRVNPAPSEMREALAVAGLEFWRAGEKAPAAKLADSALTDYFKRDDADKSKKKLSAPDAPNVWALGLLVDVKEVKDLPKDKAVDVRLVAEAIAAAAHGDVDEAKTLCKDVTVPELKLAALTAIADAGDPLAALDLIDSELAKGTLYSRWQILRAARSAAKKDWQKVNELAERLADDAELQNQIRLAALTGRLSDPKPELSFVESLPENTTARALGQLLVVRAAAAKGDNLKSEVNAWSDSQKPFGYMGMVLGRQDSKLK